MSIIAASWEIIREAAPFMLFGFLFAGLIKSFMPLEAVARHFRGRSLWSVAKSALFGIPLPLCSCAVIPAAMALRRQGASRGAVSAFLISTPESGIDSISATYALMDPVMTVARPVAAFFTAMLAGAGELLLGKNDAPPPPDIIGGCADGCCAEKEGKPAAAFTAKLRGGISYAFGDLMDDMAVWLVTGFLVAGAISAAIPPGFLENFSKNEFASMLLMLLAGIPLYVCATASTPIAAALVLKGLSPGAALVFLLSGPATNAASIVVLLKMLGKRSTAIYLGAIAAGALSMGYLLNWTYAVLGSHPRVMAGATALAIPPLAENAAGIMLCLLLARPLYHEARKRLRLGRRG